ncbi:MAG: 3-deoxy-7-phosphoheptulonate synthase [Planctomycetes bacterium]|nr:3-deoxy-7-phosphoheptulonate synthase [Planctomycetota bacterium]
MLLISSKPGHEQVESDLRRNLDGRGRLLQSFAMTAGRRGFLVDGVDDRLDRLAALPSVAAARLVTAPYSLVKREERPAGSTVAFGPSQIGGRDFVLLAGPCGVESRGQLDEVADAALRAGAVGLRGGAFKPRTSPYLFQGLGLEGLRLLAEVRERTGLPVVTEVMTPEDVDLVAEHADMLQIGSRNVQNFRLLEAVGSIDRPVLLKRGMMSTLDEYLAAAEYIYMRGNEKVVLCERGIRGFEPRLRNTLDLAGVALLKRLTHLPVLVDPSHGTGLSELVPDLARAALAVGADGVLIEVHPRPEVALSDGRQSLTPAALEELARSLAPLARALGRDLARLPGRQAEASV